MEFGVIKKKGIKFGVIKKKVMEFGDAKKKVLEFKVTIAHRMHAFRKNYLWDRRIS